MREQLDDERTLADTISPGGEWIETAGGRKHVLSYLGDFLFPAQRAQAPVKTLSGGERNRLLLARLFAQPANLVVLDEPTNDLDIESLEILESTLQSYAGTLLLVSHDRAFLDNVVTQTLVSEGRRPMEGVCRRLQRLGGATRRGAGAFAARDGTVARRTATRAASDPPSSRSRNNASSTRCPRSSKRSSRSRSRWASGWRRRTITRKARRRFVPTAHERPRSKRSSPLRLERWVALEQRVSDRQ